MARNLYITEKGIKYDSLVDPNDNVQSYLMFLTDGNAISLFQQKDLLRLNTPISKQSTDTMEKPVW